MAKKLLALAFVAALVIAFAMPAMAEVKTIKVGGDLVIRGIMRDNLDFTKKSSSPVDDGNIGYNTTTARLFVAAELSDNVSVMVRLLNERVWDEESSSTTAVDLDLAYIKMGDLFAPGLTATLGRQEILLGKGFVVGNAIPNGSNVQLTGTSVDLSDLSARKAFDAVRLDYEVGVVPLTFTLFKAKINEANDTASSTTGEADLTGLNAAYKIADNAVIEGYLLNAHRHINAEAADINTFGLRADHNVLSVPGLAYSIEAACQFGDTGNATVTDQEALAGDVDVSYTFANPYQPKIGVAWAYYSGDDPNVSDSDNEAWVPLYPDGTADRIGSLLYAIVGAPTNASIPKVYGSFKPADKHTVNLAWFPDTRLVEDESTSNKSREVGWEVDLGYTYQYTSDVSFGLLLGYMKAGDNIKNGISPVTDFDDEAMEAIGTVAVAF